MKKKESTSRTAYQNKVISNYYENLDSILVQRLSELVTELYLAEGKKREKLWDRVALTLKKMEIPEDHIGHLVASDNPALLAKRLEKML